MVFQIAVLLIVFLPFLGAFCAGLFGTRLFPLSQSHHGLEGPHSGHSFFHEEEVHGLSWPLGITTGFLCVSALLSWGVLIHFLSGGAGSQTVELFRWIQSGDFLIFWSLRVDTLTAVMLVVVTTVSALVHLYSIGYMSHDPSQPRFFCYLSLFTFAMLMLVTSNTLVQLFFGWEGVGLASYLLIGFWYHKPSANAAAQKAFVVNRVGDFGFALGIFLIWFLYGSVSFDVLFSQASTQIGKTISFLGIEWSVLTLSCLLLLMGAMGKSAQFLLHTWLPDAMEGPTPVSALIHAATMVTAGVFLIARLSPFYELAPVAQNVVVCVGMMSAFFAATVGLVQNDIKRVIAYSTCSQLGFMFAALGVGAYGVAIFHLFTHAFFKALLFLGSGSVIHALSGEQDMQKMGGLRLVLPRTFLMMLIGTLALTGFPLTAGFFSKDAILEVVYVGGNHFFAGELAFFILLCSAFCTSFYSWRLMFLTFYGSPRAEKSVMTHAHESPFVMLLPLYVLAFGALFAGLFFKGWFIGAGEHAFWAQALYRAPHNEVLEQRHHVPAWVGYAPFFSMVLGFMASYLFYIKRPDLPDLWSKRLKPVYAFLLNKWYFDELYHAVFVLPTAWLGRLLWQKGDGVVIDGWGPNGVSARILKLSQLTSRLQTGYLYHYAFVMVIGVMVAMTYALVMGR